VVVVDTLRADHLGYSGYPLPTSPQLDRIARSSVVFRNAVSSSTWTKPAIASLFTALFPSEHGVVLQAHRHKTMLQEQALPPDLPTLAEHFAAAGYTTLAVVHQPNLREETGFARGFERFVHLDDADDFATVATMLAELDRLERRQPLFAYLHLLDVHWPYSERLEGVDLDRFGAVDARERVHRDRKAVRIARRHHWHGTDRRSLRALYDQGVAWDDRAISRLVAGLRERERWLSTLVVITADHGEGLLDHHQLEHSYEPYVELSRIPLLVRLPEGWDIPPGERHSVVSLTGLGPTLLDLAGIRGFRGASGRSFAAVVRGREDPHRYALCEMEKARAIRTRDAKLIAFASGGVEFYDLRHDPGERHDLARHGCRNRCRDLLSMLSEIDARLRPPADASTFSIRFDPQRVQQLRELGYL